MTNGSSPFLLSSQSATSRLARAFAAHLQTGDVVILNGGLAAGKTFFVQAAVAALGAPEAVTSPTYTLANIYNAPLGPVVHMDAYRLESATDFADLALEDYFDHGVAFIEWGAKLCDAFDNYVALELAPTGTEGARQATLTAFGPRGAALQAQVLGAFTS